MNRIHAICLVKNEGDIIAETLSFASRFCHKIYVFDTGSVDDSWEKVTQLESSVVVPFRHESVPFSDGLRAQVFNAVRNHVADGDWIYILDADEFLAENPARAIQVAEREGAQQINTAQYNFHFTDVDWELYQQGLDSRSLPIAQRRRYYCFTNMEQRLFKYSSDLTWPEYVNDEHPHGFMAPKRSKKLKKCSYRIPNCHYQYRDPEQIQLRLETRRLARQSNQSNFIHYRALDTEVDWKCYIADSEGLNYYKNDGVFRVRLDERVSLFKQFFGTRDFFRFDFLVET